MTKIEELRAEREKRLLEVKADIKARMEMSSLTRSLAVLNNDKLTNSKVRLALVEESTNKLKALEIACNDIVDSIPIHSAKTREYRKWNPSRQYGLNTQLAILTGILSGVQYSASAHKIQMLDVIGLSEDLVEQTLEAFGSTAYYSKNYVQVIDEVEYDMELLIENIALIEEALGISLDTARLNDTVMRNRFEIARVTAGRKCAEAETAIVLSNQKTLNIEE